MTDGYHQKYIDERLEVDEGRMAIKEPVDSWFI